MKMAGFRRDEIETKFQERVEGSERVWRIRQNERRGVRQSQKIFIGVFSVHKMIDNITAGKVDYIKMNLET